MRRPPLIARRENFRSKNPLEKRLPADRNMPFSAEAECDADHTCGGKTFGIFIVSDPGLNQIHRATEMDRGEKSRVRHGKGRRFRDSTG
jgi:hypothetical protein